MRPRRACEDMRRFESSVRSLFDDCFKSRSPPIAINRDRYNSLDGQL